MALEREASRHDMTLCKYVGMLPIHCDDGATIYTQCFYNPYATDTIISPQAILDQSNDFTSWTQIGRQIGESGQLVFKGPNITRTITLHQQNGLYYCNALKFNIYQAQQDEMDMLEQDAVANNLTWHTGTTQVANPHTRKGIPRTGKYQPTSKAKILESETWSLRLGACHETQLKELPKHAIGLPSHFEFHPF
jgi:hypothetical protein